MALAALRELRQRLGSGGALPEDVPRCLAELGEAVAACGPFSDEESALAAKVAVRPRSVPRQTPHSRRRKMPPSARPQAQCVANLAARGERDAVWRALLAAARPGEARSLLQLGLATPARRYLAAAAHCCVRASPGAARRLCEDPGVAAELVDSALNCEALRSFAQIAAAPEGGEDRETVRLDGDAEWLYLLIRALVDHDGGLASLYDSAATDLDAAIST